MSNRIHKKDGTFIIYKKFGSFGLLPYHVIKDDKIYNDILKDYKKSPNTFDEEAEKEEKSIDVIKYEKICEINSIYEEKAKKVKSDTPESEVLTWDIQKLESENWQKDNNAETPFIDGLAQYRGVDRSILIHKVIEKCNAFNNFMSALTGKRQSLEDMIKAASTIEELEKIEWEN